MDRTLVLDGQLPLPRGHRIEVAEHVDGASGESSVMSILDLDTGIRYRRADERRGDLARWLGSVVDCTVTFGGPRQRTVIIVDAEADGLGAAGARAALDGADAAVDAAKAQADRWGGGDRMPDPEPERFW